jgi:hypothetical protein
LHFHMHMVHRLSTSTLFLYFALSLYCCVVTFRSNLRRFVIRQVSTILCCWLNVPVRNFYHSDGQVIHKFRLTECILLPQCCLLKRLKCELVDNIGEIKWSFGLKEKRVPWSLWENTQCSSIYKFSFWFDQFILKAQLCLEVFANHPLHAWQVDRNM